jgi:hypothetical protein
MSQLWNFGLSAASDDFAAFVSGSLSQVADPAQRTRWTAVLELALRATASKPTEKYLLEATQYIGALGHPEFRALTHQWLEYAIDLEPREVTHRQRYGLRVHEYTTSVFLAPPSVNTLRGIAWMSGLAADNTTLKLLARLAERCYRKMPGKGPIAAGVGNACLYALYRSEGIEGIGLLSRLRTRIRQTPAQTAIEGYLQEAARKKGITVHEIEDLATEQFGLKKGQKTVFLGDFSAEIAIVGIGKTEVVWRKAGQLLSKPPATALKNDFAPQWKMLKDQIKQIELTVTAQRDRLDSMFRINRSVTQSYFREAYYEHGLLYFLVKDLIWNFTAPGQPAVTALHSNGHWVNFQSEIVTLTPEMTMSLWHPALASVEEVRGWRDFLTLHEIKQPLKQAFREIYLLTDAEINTRTYSNRMAAHILRQFQFSSLAKVRGWKYTVLNAYGYSSYYEKSATLQLPEADLRAEYWVSEVNADAAHYDTGIWHYIATDQVRFTRISTAEQVELTAVPPLIFSEVMRDVDLFVGVASVGNDPAWRDSGGLPIHRDYWESYSFGDLSETAKTRKEILAGLVPRLKIAHIAHVQDRFLVVKGKLRTYKIHIGSTNILMEPNDQYLCIVPDRSAKDVTQNLFLPFEGDSGLSVILSKAFLLANDDAIADPTIVSQIKR